MSVPQQAGSLCGVRGSISRLLGLCSKAARVFVSCVRQNAVATSMSIANFAPICAANVRQTVVPRFQPSYEDDPRYLGKAKMSCLMSG